jgi:hypothetical protein
VVCSAVLCSCFSLFLGRGVVNLAEKVFTLIVILVLLEPQCQNEPVTNEQDTEKTETSTPYHSLVPSVARAADEAKMAGTTPAAAAIKLFFASTGADAMERADLTPKAEK